MNVVSLIDTFSVANDFNGQPFLTISLKFATYHNLRCDFWGHGLSDQDFLKEKKKKKRKVYF